ncbi:leucine-rich repeat domain-containing protein [Lachnoclostridium phytofermentans]|uniref:Leucine-rich repeat protein n=1 Tax=Lachnoclostridium phytofermentans (strain ATCC 700394 / DSM 18823 / ISDg) TaxID=357809 RepID=A9KSX3_LACP7|nr:leucine-rich repeat domain-containing protein [Lachnoclostridium phytofermentans]ABX42184.1 leucine-rich repeat protein [Lachnoclostridium phytofermentans ISDg]
MEKNNLNYTKHCNINDKNKLLKRLIKSYLCFLIITIYLIQSLPVKAADSTSDTSASDNNSVKTGKQKSGELHAFYPSNAVFSEQMKQYIDDLESISFAWSRIDAEDSGCLNSVKGQNGNYGFYYPNDYLQPLEYAKSQGKSIQLNIYMDGPDGTKLLPYADERAAMVSAIVNTVQSDLSLGEDIYYDGVVIDFEGLRNTDGNGNSILYNGKPISTYYTQFLTELREQFDSIGKNLYVAVNPALYFDGYDYSKILNVADRVIVMAHDYEPVQKVLKNQIEQYTGYNALDPTHSLAPIQMVRMALNDIRNAASNTSELSKVWLQIAFDTAQWQFDVKSAKEWTELPTTTLSRGGRLTPLYKSIKARIDNTDGYGQNLSYGYNNELQSPYIQYFNTSDKSWNVIIYEDSSSISAKIELAKSYNLGGISLWSLANIPDYNDTNGKKYHLNAWNTIIAEMKTYDTLPAESSKYVSFTDAFVEKAVREKLGKVSGKISVEELHGIYRLKLPKGVKSLKDLNKLANLEYLDAGQLGIKDITAIGNLKNIRVLYLQRNLVSDISALKKLTKLEVLSLNGNQIESISALSTLTNLRELYIRENKIKNISSLNKLTKLILLEGGKNNLQNIDSLKNLKNIKSLTLDNNIIKDITGLKVLTNLKYLDLSNNKITSINALKNLSGLETLYLQRNSITDISAISTLKKLKLLSMNGNKISDVKPLTKLANLEKLYLKDNKIKSIASLKGLVNLNELYLMGNSVSNYSPVKTMYAKKGFVCDFKIN